jgi:hypothetical protein
MEEDKNQEQLHPEDEAILTVLESMDSLLIGKDIGIALTAVRIMQLELLQELMSIKTLQAEEAFLQYMKDLNKEMMELTSNIEPQSQTIH